MHVIQFRFVSINKSVYEWRDWIIKSKDANRIFRNFVHEQIERYDDINDAPHHRYVLHTGLCMSYPFAWSLFSPPNQNDGQWMHLQQSMKHPREYWIQEYLINSTCCSNVWRRKIPSLFAFSADVIALSIFKQGSCTICTLTKLIMTKSND
jgi:hypothetical protein